MPFNKVNKSYLDFTIANDFKIRLDSCLLNLPLENEDDNEPISCCDDNDNGIQDLRSSSPENAEVCFPITIKTGDLGRDSTCLNFVRSR